jgi:hypothetical protein
VLIGGMFVYPVLIEAIFLPSFKQGLFKTLPAYERMLIDIAVICIEWKFVLVLPVVALGILFTILGATMPRTRA